MFQISRHNAYFERWAVPFHQVKYAAAFFSLHEVVPCWFGLRFASKGRSGREKGLPCIVIECFCTIVTASNHKTLLGPRRTPPASHLAEVVGSLSKREPTVVFVWSYVPCLPWIGEFSSIQFSSRPTTPQLSTANPCVFSILPRRRRKSCWKTNTNRAAQYNFCLLLLKALEGIRLGVEEELAQKATYFFCRSFVWSVSLSRRVAAQTELYAVVLVNEVTQPSQQQHWQ